MERISIAIYRPLKGKEAELLAVVKDHQPILTQQNLVSDRKPVVMRAADGSIVEIFGWKSKDAINAAHTNPAVAALWERFGKVCEYVKPVDVKEFGDLFAEFEPIDL